MKYALCIFCFLLLGTGPIKESRTDADLEFYTSPGGNLTKQLTISSSGDVGMVAGNTLKVDKIKNAAGTGSVELTEGATLPSGEQIDGVDLSSLDSILGGAEYSPTYNFDQTATCTTVTQFSRYFRVKNYVHFVGMCDINWTGTAPSFIGITVPLDFKSTYPVVGRCGLLISTSEVVSDIFRYSGSFTKMAVLLSGVSSGERLSWTCDYYTE